MISSDAGSSWHCLPAVFNSVIYAEIGTPVLVSSGI